MLTSVASSAEVTHSRDAITTALTERLDQLDSAVARPALTEEQLSSALAPLLARLEEAATGSAVTEQLAGLEARLAALDARFEAVAGQLGDVAAAAGGVPALAADVQAVAGRLGELATMGEQLAGVASAVGALQEDPALPSLVMSVAALREGVEDVSGRVNDLDVPRAEVLADGVSRQVADRLVDELAPRVAELVMNRVASTLVEQVAGSVTASVQEGLTEKVRAAGADSERRLSAHVDEAILALAEALLRRRRSARTSAAPVVASEAGASEGADDGLVVVTVEDSADTAALERVVAWSGGDPDAVLPEIEPALLDAAPTDQARAEVGEQEANDGYAGQVKIPEPPEGHPLDEVEKAEPSADAPHGRAFDETDQFPEVESAVADPPNVETPNVETPNVETPDPETPDPEEPADPPLVSRSPLAEPMADEAGIDEPAAPEPGRPAAAPATPHSAVTTSTAPRRFGGALARPAGEAVASPVEQPPAYEEFSLPRSGAEAGTDDEGLFGDDDEDGPQRRPWWRPGG